VTDETRIEEFRESFDECDRNGDGTIQFEEFVILLHNLDADMSDHECRIGFREIDVNGDGGIDFDEFKTWWIEH
jgi:Ca2+-binding EF-hand superfamily protein